VNPSTGWRLLALLFAVFVLFIIITANLGIAGNIFGRVYNFPNGDKIAHFTLFGMLGLLAGLSFPTRRVYLPGIALLKSSLVLGALITLEEISQIAIANRSFDLIDLAASLSGVLLFGEIGTRLFTKRSHNMP